MQFEEFSDCVAWWNNRTENEQAWLVLRIPGEGERDSGMKPNGIPG
jgi:hypothetical protein